MPSSRIVSALVFSRKNMGEADRIVTFFTKGEGLIRVIAKGVRKIPSSRGGHLEPCTMVSAALHESKAGVYAGNVETDEYFHALREDKDAFARACEHIRLFHSLFDTGQAVPEVFDAFASAWRAYPLLSPEKRISMDASLSLLILQHAGLMPDMRLWHTQVRDNRSLAVIKYLAQNPEHAVRLALSEQDASLLKRTMRDILAQHVGMPVGWAGMVY